MLTSTLILGAALGAPPVAFPPTQSLLSAVPEDAHAVTWCADIQALRQKLERNDWVRLGASPGGKPLLTDLGGLFVESGGMSLENQLDVALELRGEGVMFTAPGVNGFLTSPPSEPDALERAMRAWLPAGQAPAMHDVQNMLGARIDLVGWPDDSGFVGHVAAFVDHPLAFGIFSADDGEALVRGLRASLSGLGGERLAPVVRKLQAAMKAGGRGGVMEVLVDFSSMASDAEEALERAAAGMLSDPVKFLGLEQGTWLHLSFDAFPGARLECRGHLEIPKGSLAARLADTWVGLPPALPGDVPVGTWSMIAANWDLSRFWTVAREGLEERKSTLQIVEEGLAMANAMSGTNLERDILGQLSGLFTAYLVHSTAPTDTDAILDEELMTFGVQVGLKDGRRFQDAVEALMDNVKLTDEFDLFDIDGIDVYGFGDGELSGGFAFLPDALVLAPERGLLELSLAAQAGREHAGLLNGGPLQSAFDENQGACFFTYVEAAGWFELRGHRLEDLQLPVEGADDEVQPFEGRLVGAIERTGSGFDLRLYTR